MQLIVVSKTEGIYQKVLQGLEEECFDSDVLHAHSLGEALELFESSEKGIIITDPESFQSVKKRLAREGAACEHPGEKRKFEEEIAYIRYYVRMHLQYNLTLADIARAIGLSPNYLSSLFHKETGMSLRQFIDESRMQKAAYLLETEDSFVSEVAERVGFTSTSYFCKVFKNCFGESPKQYRISHRIERNM